MPGRQQRAREKTHSMETPFPSHGERTRRWSFRTRYPGLGSSYWPAFPDHCWASGICGVRHPYSRGAAGALHSSSLKSERRMSAASSREARCQKSSGELRAAYPFTSAVRTLRMIGSLQKSPARGALGFGIVFAEDRAISTRRLGSEQVEIADRGDKHQREPCCHFGRWDQDRGSGGRCWSSICNRPDTGWHR